MPRRSAVNKCSRRGRWVGGLPRDIVSTSDTATQQTSHDSRAEENMPYVTLNRGRTQAQLVLPDTLLEELRCAEEDFAPSVLRTLGSEHVVLVVDEYGAYFNEMSMCRKVASMRGNKRSKNGYGWSAVLEFEAYDPDDPQKRILNDEQNSLPVGIVVLPGNKSVGEISETGTARPLLREKSFDFSLQGSKGTISDWLSELNGEEGLLCDWYRLEEETSMASLNADKLPSYKSLPKQKARLRGRLTLHVDLTGHRMTSPVREDRSLQLTHPQGEASSSQEVEGSTVATASASSGATDAESDLVDPDISQLSIG